MDAKVRNDQGREFVRSVAGSLSAALSLATGELWPFEVSDIYDLQGEAAAQFSIEVSKSLYGEFFIEFFDPLFTKLADQVSRQSEKASKNKVEALIPVLESSMRGLSDTLAAQYGPIQFTVKSLSGPVERGMWMVPFSSVEDRSKAALHLSLDDALLDALTAAAETEGNPSSDSSPVQTANLKLVMDVELNVSLRFGQRQMPLRDVLALASGSVVELDRKVDEPVELLLDGRLVARGEAVIVDGNYGLRVTEIPRSIQSHFFN